MTFLITAVLVTQPTSAPTADAVIARVLAERAKIRSWHVTGSYTTADAASASNNRSQRFELWRDGNKARADLRPLGSDPGPSGKPYEREVSCIGCWPTDDRWVRVVFPYMPVSHIPPPHRQPHAMVTSMARIDIRKIGLLPSVPLSSNADRPIDGELRLIPLTVAGAGAAAGGVITLHGQHPENWYTQKVTVDPGQGYSVTAIECEGVTPRSDPPRRFRERTRVVPARDAASGLWYARESAFSRTVDGQPALDLTVTLDAVELNRPIDPTAFSLAGIGVPVGYGVSTAFRPSMQYWDGTKVVDSPPANREVSYSPPPAAPPEPVDPSGEPAGPFGVVTAVLAVLFATAAVLLLRRAIRRRAG